MTNSHLQKAPCGLSETQYCIASQQHFRGSLNICHTNQLLLVWKKKIICKRKDFHSLHHLGFISMGPLKQGCPILHLAGGPVSCIEFSSNLPQHTCPTGTGVDTPALRQQCPILLLEGHLPKEFSLNPN